LKSQILICASHMTAG